MLRRLIHRPLYVRFTEKTWTFISSTFRLRHAIKILMARAQLRKFDDQFHPGYYEVAWKFVDKRPMLVFIPLGNE